MSLKNCYLGLFTMFVVMFQFKMKLMIFEKQFSSMFVIFVFLNSMGFPFFWSLTSFFWVNFLIALMILFTLWMNLWVKAFMSMFSILLPLNSPKFLWESLIFMELVGQLIRPLTLSLRLSCNMMAGHVLLFLLSQASILAPFLIMMLILELFIMVIQAVVFSLLTKQYSMELN